MCDFCKGRYKSLRDFAVNSKNRFCLDLRDDKTLIIRKQVGNSPYWNNFLSTIEPIKYCPFCGKRLGEDKELNNIIEAIEKALKDNIEELKDLTFSYDRIYEDKEILKLIQELKGSEKE